MTAVEAIHRRPVRIAWNLLSLYRDEAEEIVYLAQNIEHPERYMLLNALRRVRCYIFNRRGY